MKNMEKRVSLRSGRVIGDVRDDESSSTELNLCRDDKRKLLISFPLRLRHTIHLFSTKRRLVEQNGVACPGSLNEQLRLQRRECHRLGASVGCVAVLNSLFRHWEIVERESETLRERKWEKYKMKRKWKCRRCGEWGGGQCGDIYRIGEAEPFGVFRGKFGILLRRNGQVSPFVWLLFLEMPHNEGNGNFTLTVVQLTTHTTSEMVTLITKYSTLILWVEIKFFFFFLTWFIFSGANLYSLLKFEK